MLLTSIPRHYDRQESIMKLPQQLRFPDDASGNAETTSPTRDMRQRGRLFNNWCGRSETVVIWSHLITRQSVPMILKSACPEHKYRSPLDSVLHFTTQKKWLGSGSSGSKDLLLRKCTYSANFLHTGECQKQWHSDIGCR
jgi:hypothetical protein